MGRKILGYILTGVFFLIVAYLGFKFIEDLAFVISDAVQLFWPLAILGIVIFALYRLLKN